MRLYTSLIVNYDAQNRVIERLKKRGAIVQRVHCVKVGKRAQIFYYLPDANQPGDDVDPWGDLEPEDGGADYTVIYWTPGLSGKGLRSYGNIITNAPSQQAVMKMFALIVNGPSSQIWECRRARTDEIYRRIPYVDLYAL